MNAIFKQNNVYVVAPRRDIRDDVNVEEITELIYDAERDGVVNLYGGRVEVSGRDSWSVCLEVDGIQIYEISFSEFGECQLGPRMTFNKAVAYLNQIENLGIDTFLDNYKLQLKNLKAEVESSVTKMEQELVSQYDEDKSKVLENLRITIRSLSCLIFMLMINLNAGLDNHVYVEVYNDIVNLYF